MRIIPIIAALTLSACATPEQRAEEMASYITDSYGPTCTKLGYATGSDNHRNCMVSMYQADQVRNSMPWHTPPPIPGYRIRR